MANGASKSAVNGYVNGTTGPRPLNIAIIGAGIGGLSVAMGLRKNGHHVSVSFYPPKKPNSFKKEPPR